MCQKNECTSFIYGFDIDKYNPILFKPFKIKTRKSLLTEELNRDIRKHSANNYIKSLLKLPVPTVDHPQSNGVMIKYESIQSNHMDQYLKEDLIHFYKIRCRDNLTL
jgi:hypothetical protein